MMISFLVKLLSTSVSHLTLHVPHVIFGCTEFCSIVTLALCNMYMSKDAGVNVSSFGKKEPNVTSFRSLTPIRLVMRKGVQLQTISLS